MVIFSSTVVEKHTSLNSKENIVSKIAPQHLGGGGLEEPENFTELIKTDLLHLIVDNQMLWNFKHQIIIFINKLFAPLA